MNHYASVFTESAWVASVIPLSSEPTFFAMLAFGTFPMWPAWVAAVTGATLGQLFNWYVGQWILKLGNKSQKPLNGPKYEKIQRFFHKYGIFLLLFSWAPMLNLLVVAAGMLNVRLKTALPLIIAGQAAAYGFYLL